MPAAADELARRNDAFSMHNLLAPVKCSYTATRHHYQSQYSLDYEQDHAMTEDQNVPQIVVVQN